MDKNLYETDFEKYQPLYFLQSIDLFPLKAGFPFYTEYEYSLMVEIFKGGEEYLCNSYYAYTTGAVDSLNFSGNLNKFKLYIQKLLTAHKNNIFRKIILEFDPKITYNKETYHAALSDWAQSLINDQS